MRAPRLAKVLLAAALATIHIGCAALTRAPSPTVAADLDKLREEMDVLPPFPEPAPASGSLWTDAGPGAALVRDTRAFRVNDLVRIRVDESDLGANSSNTDLTRSSAAEVGAPIVFGLEDPTAGPGDFNLANVLSTSFDSNFSGDGTTTRSSRLEGFITARVMQVLPNGDLVIAGQKTVMVNRDRQILTLVGSVRPVDVGPTNQVTSSSVGDLTVRLWGKGEVDDTVRQGWFMRIMNRVWPF
jgi:flagellar L-ring protein precursor FlgH